MPTASSRFGAAARSGFASSSSRCSAAPSLKVTCEARAVDQRTVRNSGGGVEKRYIIATLLKLGEESWPIELALANRDQMGFRMLLGRTALQSRVLIEPGRSFLLGARPARLRRRRVRVLSAAGQIAAITPEPNLKPPVETLP